VVDKQRIPTPHSFYLPMPLAEDGNWTSHYETAGAVVELDREQLPGANRHFVPTQRFIRLQGQSRGLTVASPDLPLFQVGGFTFGRHERGVVKRDRPVLLAWLNNNYWDTNFEVTQSGPLVTRFTLVPHPAEPVGRSIERIVPYVVEPQLHLLNAGGPGQGVLLEVEAQGLLLTGFRREDDRVSVFVLNPDDSAHTLSLGPGEGLRPLGARRIDLAGNAHGEIEVVGGRLTLEVPPRVWMGVSIDAG
jgi:hypothetical protein